MKYPLRLKACACCGTQHPVKARRCRSCGVPQRYWRPLTSAEIRVEIERIKTVRETFDRLVAERAAKDRIAALLAEREAVLTSDKARSEALYAEVRALWPVAFPDG